MIIAKKVYPYVDSNGTPRYDLDYHYGVRVEVENGEEVEYERYKIRQVETNTIYDEAVDTYPCRYTYEATEEKIEQEKQEQENSENIAELHL